MFAPLETETPGPRPWTAVLLGVVGAAVFGFAASAYWAEAAAMQRQAGPEDVTVEAALAPGKPRRWVRVHGGRWDCERAIQVERGPVERAFFGRVQSTQVPVANASGRALLVLKYAGEVSCGEVAGRPVAGVLTQPGDRLWGTRLARPLSGTATRVLCVDCGPAPARRRAAVAGVLAFACWTLASYALRSLAAERERDAHAALVSNRPIEPR